MKLPQRIDRYDTVKLLGRGAEGAVMLAIDRELGRPVALKLLRPDAVQNGQKLANEARIVSRLQHSNIVTLYDVGEYGPCPYLVFEFIDGESLKDRIQRDGPLGVRDSVILMSQVLAGVAYMHENGIVHRDLKPANILISVHGTPKVADFGVSSGLAVEEANGEVCGTLRYTSPEAIQGLTPGRGSDVFSLGAVFYEMLAGRALFDYDKVRAVTHAILHGAPIDGATLGPDLAPLLVDVLRTASQRDPAHRYRDARAMKDALDAYRVPRDERDATRDGGVLPGSVDYLLNRIARRKGFSSLSAHIGKVLELTADESIAPARKLVNVLAKDLTLTQRIIGQANAASTGFSQIDDLSAAVRLLGLNQVRQCVTRTLLEREFELGSEHLREVMLTSFHAAVLAKVIAREVDPRSETDAFTAAMFHDLGRTLVIHYLADDYEEIVERTRELSGDEIAESRRVLGIAYHELGMAIGREWRLSETILASMRPLPRGQASEPSDRQQRLGLCAAFANAASRVMAEAESDEERDARLAELLERVGPALGLGPSALDEACAEAASLVPKYARLIKLDPAHSAVAQRLTAAPSAAEEGAA